MFDLDEQLNLFSRADGLEATVDTWYIGVSDFLVENGVLAENPPVENYITDKYLVMIAANETLKEFTLKSSSGYIAPSDGDGEGEEAGEDTASSGAVAKMSHLVLAVASLAAVALVY